MNTITFDASSEVAARVAPEASVETGAVQSPRFAVALPITKAVLCVVCAVLFGLLFWSPRTAARTHTRQVADALDCAQQFDGFMRGLAATDIAEVRKFASDEFVQTVGMWKQLRVFAAEHPKLFTGFRHLRATRFDCALTPGSPTTAVVTGNALYADGQQRPVRVAYAWNGREWVVCGFSFEFFDSLGPSNA